VEYARKYLNLPKTFIMRAPQINALTNVFGKRRQPKQTPPRRLRAGIGKQWAAVWCWSVKNLLPGSAEPNLLQSFQIFLIYLLFLLLGRNFYSGPRLHDSKMVCIIITKCAKVPISFSTISKFARNRQVIPCLKWSTVLKRLTAPAIESNHG